VLLRQEEIVVVLREAEMRRALGAHGKGSGLRLLSEHGFQKGIFSC
jgi:hypothetical protein